MKKWSVNRDGASAPAGLQAHVAFHLSGVRRGLDTIEGFGLRPALFARYGKLSDLRYDFPLLLSRGGMDETSVRPLSAAVDEIIARTPAPAAEPMRKASLQLERAARELIGEGGFTSWPELLAAATTRAAENASAQARANLDALGQALRFDAEVVDCGEATARRVCEHLWKIVFVEREKRFRKRVDRLVAGLKNIVQADLMRSAPGLSPGSLKASLGGPQRQAFDFDALSRLLSKNAPQTALSGSRRQRIDWLLTILQSQRFYAAPGVESFNFVFTSCAAAIAAYRERLPQIAELGKAFAIAELEIDGAYVEARHDAFFETFGEGALDAAIFDLFPDYLVFMSSADMQAGDNEAILEASAGGLRAKVVVQTDDILEPSPVGGHIALGMRSKRLANAAIALSEVFVVQTTSSNLPRFRYPLYRAFAYAEPALISVYSGVNSQGIPAYLDAAGAMESRLFPAFVYDPSAGPDWASRFDLDANPQLDGDWPIYGFEYENRSHQRCEDRLAFTLVDFVAMDPRYASHFALVPSSGWNDGMVSVTDFLEPDHAEAQDKAPCIWMVDDDNSLHKALVDDGLVREARRCADMWRSLQELGGIRNSHAQRLLARERKAWEAQSKPAAAPSQSATTEAVAPAAVAPVSEPVERERAPDEPYIETFRCSTCNECTQLNPRMFAYDENKQAYIADPDAGSYAQLVEAAESCQVSIIHPGKPRNPDEPGLEDLLARAEAFN